MGTQWVLENAAMSAEIPEPPQMMNPRKGRLSYLTSELWEAKDHSLVSFIVHFAFTCKNKKSIKSSAFAMF